VTKKPDSVLKLLEKVEPRSKLPKPLKEGSLLEQGMLVVLVRHLAQGEAERVLGELKRAYPDWNELRVAQGQEIASLIATGGRRAAREAVDPLLPVVRTAREYLQEIFQKNHGFDLEFLREDPVGGAKVFAHMPFLGLAGTCYLLWIAAGKQVPAHPALVRVLERLGLVAKGAAGKKGGKDVLTPLLPPGRELDLVAVLGEVADRWCLHQKPLCHECPLVDECSFGRKAFQEWKVQQARLETQRQKEAARRAIFEKKEAERRAKEAARAAKKAAADAAKAARERERLARVEQKRKEADARAKAKADAAAKKAAAEAAKKAAAEARKQAETQRKAEAEARKAKEREKAAKAKAKAAAKKATKPAKPAKKSGKKKR
jgi:hypothetical protein